MEPDMYGGKECDELVPRWRCYAAGDKDADHQRQPLILDPRDYPPGTKITVMEPTCPECDMVREVTHNPRGFSNMCACGFDWEEWTANEYS
jgi:hypothetical protein